MKSDKKSITSLVMTGILTAIVIILQLWLQLPIFGIATLSTVLVPIVIGAILYGPSAGAWLGLVFAGTVILSGQAAPFMAENGVGTVLMVIVKGVACGAAAGIVYKIFSKKNNNLAVLLAAIVAPVVNTGIYVIGSTFLYDNEAQKLFLTVAVLFNFIAELVFNIILNPAILFLTNYVKKGHN